MTLTEASEVAEILARTFREVHINGSEAHPTIHAKGHHIIPLHPGCPHKVKLIAKNLTAIIKGGHLASGSAGMEVRYGSVEFCQRCEAVFSTTPYVR